ncbi:MAG: copper(I)-binding protein [Gammaproteobacteria bacterium]|jgi:copper(I)-binding protein
MPFLTRTSLLAGLTLLFTAALSGITAAGGHLASEHVQIMQPWSRALPAVSTNGAAYLRVNNGGTNPARIVSASSPIAAQAELHSHINEDGLMKMRQITDGVAVPAGGTVAFASGGMHIMLLKLKEPLTPGKTFPLTLRFEDGGSQTVIVNVLNHEQATKMISGMGHGKGHGAGHNPDQGMGHDKMKSSGYGKHGG